jgi:hypothetical protein
MNLYSGRISARLLYLYAGWKWVVIYNLCSLNPGRESVRYQLDRKPVDLEQV